MFCEHRHRRHRRCNNSLLHCSTLMLINHINGIPIGVIVCLPKQLYQSFILHMSKEECTQMEFNFIHGRTWIDIVPVYLFVPRPILVTIFSSQFKFQDRFFLLIHQYLQWVRYKILQMLRQYSCAKCCCDLTANKWITAGRLFHGIELRAKHH